MFWNLVRYEFKNVNKWFFALYAAVLSLSVINIILIALVVQFIKKRYEGDYEERGAK